MVEEKILIVDDDEFESKKNSDILTDSGETNVRVPNPSVLFSFFPKILLKPKSIILIFPLSLASVNIILSGFKSL